MKLFVYDKYRVNVYPLPDKVEDFYMINYYYGSESILETITLEAKDGVWTMNTDETVHLTFNGKPIDHAVLSEYTNYEIKFADLDEVLSIQVVPNTEDYVDLSMKGISNIMIGSGPSCHINYNNNRTLLNHANISVVNNQYVIKGLDDVNGFVYVNKKRIQQHSLQFGDVIFINGLKIIWMDQYIRINNPNNKIAIAGLNRIELEKKSNDYTPTTETERNMKRFKESQLFFHTPRLKKDITFEKVSIESPPDEERNEQMPMFLSLGSSAIIGITSCMTGISAAHGLMTGQISVFNAGLEFFMCFLMLIACVLFPLLTDMWQKKKIKEKENLRQLRYKKYLENKVNTINDIIKKQEGILIENNFKLEDIQKKIVNRSTSVWGREIVDDDFLTLSLGVGELPAALEVEAQIEQFSLYDDNLKEEVEKIATEKRKLKNVPITISMLQNRVTPFLINAKFKQQYIDSLMLQLMFYYSSLDLKIVLFTNEMNEDQWSYLKYLPHCWSNDKEKRFFATNENEMMQISMYLEQEYDRRIKDDTNQEEEKKNTVKFENQELYKNYDEYYLIITDDFTKVNKSPIINRILNDNVNAGFSLMIFDNALKNVPSRLEKFIDIGDNTSGLFSRMMEEESHIPFKPQYISFNMEEYAKIIENIPLSSKDHQATIPSSISFLDMYHAGRIDHLNILSKWANNDPTTSLHAPVGLKEEDRLVELDLHEKYHGPHGLIAGTTGSGKSEFIISYILSMAINYHPDEVQFVLIDYKGGGLAGAFENRETGIKIPHLIGTITNLDTSEMNRTLVSIKSELQRRQICFNQAREALGEGTIDIYKYQRLYREGKVKEPMAHLFVISDEFAELKDQQPDFMDELISTARIGRSLGVHLILATQKPTGVVNDQIWSNSRFRVCLKVQTSEDSLEMLKRPEAMNIKEAGRFYLQVGNDEIFELGQSGWAGAKYIPTDRVLKKVNDSIDFVSNDGNIIKSINDEIKIDERVDLGEQLTNIVKYLYELANRENIPFRSLWLPSLPTKMYLGNLVKKYNYRPALFDFMIPVGEYDKPARQSQGLYSIDLSCKNTIIFGLPGSGKENLLTSLIYSSCIYHTPQEINFYIHDFGSEAMSTFYKMPHVGDVITSSEKEKVAAQFEFLEKEIKKRKELFSEYAGDFNMYVKKSGSKVPLIVTVINGYESFMENCAEYEDYLNHLLREGSKYGVIFIFTVVSTNSIRSSVVESFANKMILQTSDPFDYQYFLGAASGLVPKKNFGRGITIVDEEACEFQTAYISDKDNINLSIKQTGKYLSETYHYKVNSIKILPDHVTLKEMLPFAKEVTTLPIGISRDSADRIKWDITKHPMNVILGNTVIDDADFMCSLIDLIDAIPGVRLNIIDFLTCINTDGNAAYYNDNFKDILQAILLNQAEIPTVNIILGIGDVEELLLEEDMKLFQMMLGHASELKNQSFIIIDNYDRFKKIRECAWYPVIDNSSGIWVGKGIDEQEVFTLTSLTNYDVEEKLSNIIYVIEEGMYTVTIGMSSEEVEELF